MFFASSLLLLYDLFFQLANWEENLFWTNKMLIFFFRLLKLRKKFVEKICETNWWKYLMNSLKSHSKFYKFHQKNGILNWFHSWEFRGRISGLEITRFLEYVTYRFKLVCCSQEVQIRSSYNGSHKVRIFNFFKEFLGDFVQSFHHYKFSFSFYMVSSKEIICNTYL